MATLHRKEWIDALRAMAMLIVMVWHFSNGLPSQWIYSIFTSAIMIPLFFTITGYVFNDCDGNEKLFFPKLFKHLVLPWIILALLKGGIIALIRGGSWTYYREYFLNLFTGDNLWYFPCCIIAETLWFMTLKMSKSRIKIIVMDSLVLCLLGAFLSNFTIFDNSNISTAFICQSFLLLGYVIKYMDNENQVSKIVNTSRCTIITSVAYIMVCIAIIKCPPPIGIVNEIAMDVHRNYFYNIGVIACLVLLGNFSIFRIAKYIDKFPKFLTFIGQNTIIFYIFHYDTLMPLSILSKKLGYDLSSWGYVPLKIIWSILICSLLASVINNYIPELAGKKR